MRAPLLDLDADECRDVERALAATRPAAARA
jgi:hypothetical protein